LGSPGRIVLEPGISVAIAVLVGLLLGGYLGERHQSGGAAVDR
jgi:hypothetical protein